MAVGIFFGHYFAAFLGDYTEDYCPYRKKVLPL